MDHLGSRTRGRSNMGPFNYRYFQPVRPKRYSRRLINFSPRQNFGSSVFISVSIAIMIRTGGMNYAHLSQSISPLNEALNFQYSLFSIWSLDGAERLAALSGEVGRQAVMIGYINAFYAFCMTAFAICPFLFLAKVRR